MRTLTLILILAASLLLCDTLVGAKHHNHHNHHADDTVAVDTGDDSSVFHDYDDGEGFVHNKGGEAAHLDSEQQSTDNEHHMEKTFEANALTGIAIGFLLFTIVFSFFAGRRGVNTRKVFAWQLVFSQIFFIGVLIGTGKLPYANQGTEYYGFYTDVTFMLVIGFGYLMTFLRRYAFSALAITFLITVVGIQWHTILHFAFPSESVHNDEMQITLWTLVQADFGVAAVLISFGALLGRTTAAQMYLIAVVELFFYQINVLVVEHFLEVQDTGGSLLIHAFGAYFGLSVSKVLINNKNLSKPEEKDNSSITHSDTFAMLGSIFLWVLWPSFTSVPDVGSPALQGNAIINTIIALCASAMVTFAFSAFFRGEEFRYDMVDIQNASLAGGVAIGTSCDLIKYNAGFPALIGTVAGLISAYGFAKLTPALEKRFGLNDTCGVHNLHGMPGILGGIASIITLGLSAESEDNDQAVVNAYCIFVTLAMALITGAFTGLVCKLLPNPESAYNDSHDFVTPDDFKSIGLIGADEEEGEEMRDSNDRANRDNRDNRDGYRRFDDEEDRKDRRRDRSRHSDDEEDRKDRRRDRSRHSDEEDRKDRRRDRSRRRDNSDDEKPVRRSERSRESLRRDRRRDRK